MKNNSKNKRKSPHATSTFSIENNSKNLRSMLHHLLPRHIFSLKNNSKNSTKSPRPISHFSIEK
jgi:hypothetical protein